MVSCQARLVSWNKLEFDYVVRKISELQKRLQSMKLANSDMASRAIKVVH